MATQMSKKKKKTKFVADGVFKAEKDEFRTRELAEDGDSGVEVRVTPTRTAIITLAARTQNVLGEKGRRIRASSPRPVRVAALQAAGREAGPAVRAATVRCASSWSGAEGCEVEVVVVVSGKLRGQRAKSMKFGRGGVLGIKVKITPPWDTTGEMGPKKPLPDHVSIVEPTDEVLPTGPNL
ncbi:unnamed protein product [Lampetra fluviatilis]